MPDRSWHLWPPGLAGGTTQHGENRVATGFSPLPPASLPFAILTLVNAPYKRGFYCGDDSIRYPYRPDTITHGLMAGVTITATIILVRQERLEGGRLGAGGGAKFCPEWYVGKGAPPFGVPRIPADSGRPGTPKPFLWGVRGPASQGLVETLTVASPAQP